MRCYVFLLLLLIGNSAVGQVASEEEPGTAEEPSTVVADDLADQEKLFAGFSSLLKKSALVGTFTIDGDDKLKPRPERYEISRIAKQDKGDYWVFFARIEYGKHDVTLPIPVEVKWAGTTPVITVDNLQIPAMGTFDARVVISDNKYAGTWRHGEVGGLMYGHIEKQTPEEASPKEESEITGE